MAFFDSKVSKFLIDDTGSVQRDLSAYITEVRGLPGSRNLNEVTWRYPQKVCKQSGGVPSL